MRNGAVSERDRRLLVVATAQNGSFGNPAGPEGPVALRPRLATGLPLSGGDRFSSPIGGAGGRGSRGRGDWTFVRSLRRRAALALMGAAWRRRLSRSWSCSSPLTAEC